MWIITEKDQFQADLNLLKGLDMFREQLVLHWTNSRHIVVAGGGDSALGPNPCGERKNGGNVDAWRREGFCRLVLPHLSKNSQSPGGTAVGSRNEEQSVFPCLFGRYYGIPQAVAILPQILRTRSAFSRTWS